MAVRVLASAPVDVDVEPEADVEDGYPSPRRIPPLALAVVLIPVALDLLTTVMPAQAQAMLLPRAVASVVAAVLLLMLWLRYPRASWLAAAVLAAAISVVLRVNGDQAAALVSLLSVVALGIGGGFASGDLSEVESEPSGGSEPAL